MEYITSARKAELNASDFLRGHGYPDAQATAVGTDAGIDITSRHAVAQVKWTSRPAGRPWLQNLRGSCLDDRHTIFFCLSGYTQQALAYSESVNMTLYRFNNAGEVWQCNSIPLPERPRTFYSPDWMFVARLVNSLLPRRSKRRKRA